MQPVKPATKRALVIKLIESLQEHGSWCGETHVQKATYFLQNVAEVPTEFDFILYKHGPFSFDLSDELAMMRADNLLELEYYPYGAKIIVTQSGNAFLENCRDVSKKYYNGMNDIAETLGNKGVAALERLATALYVTLKEGKDKEAKERASILHELKHHIPIAKAKEAVAEVDKIIGNRLE